MDASLLNTQTPARGLKFSSVVRLGLAATAALALTYTGVSYLNGAAPALKATNAKFEANELGAPDALMAQHFTQWMDTHGKQYPTAEEMALRFEIYKDNARFIREENAAGHSYTVGENEFMDITSEEFKRNYLGLDVNFFKNMLGKDGDVDEDLAKVDMKDLPPSLDWREKGCVTDVKNQGQCGSCWAFSSTGALEGAYCAAGLGQVDLSEQQLVDCSKKQGNAGCRGGLMTQAFQYVMANKGICAEKDYPYKGAVARLFFSACKAKKCKNVMNIDGFSAVPKASDSALMAALVQKGPIAVAIQADQRAFQFYKSGVFTQACGTNLDHAVLAVGYGTENGQDYYTIKNSWGGSWGDKGYIKLGRGPQYNGGQGQCGVLMWSVFPKVKA